MGDRKFMLRPFDPDTEDLFDFMKEFASDQLSGDLFQDEPEVVLCEVLKVFDVARNTKHKSWLDSILPGRGRRLPIICFKGRILSRTGTLHAHSNLPNPRWMPGSEGGGAAATTQAHWWIDMHPTFVGRGKDKIAPKVGEIVTVEFVKGYTSAAGEFCGIFKDFYEASIGPDGLISEKIDPKKPFGPDARLLGDNKPPPPKLPFEIPKRILFIGDEMFGGSAGTAGVSTNFAAVVRGMISEFYTTLFAGSASRLVSKFHIPKSRADELVGRMNTSTIKSDEKTEGIMRHLEVEFHNIAVAWTDGTFWSDSGATLYKKENLKYKQPWKAGAEAKKTTKVKSGVAVLKEVIKSKNSRGQPFDFAIIAGPVGQSTVPGWGAPISGADKKWQAFYKSLDNVDGKSPDRKDGCYRLYANQVARQMPDKVRAEKKKHFEELLDLVFKGGAIKGAVLMGPPLNVKRGVPTFKDSRGKSLYQQTFIEKDNVTTQVTGYKRRRGIRYHGKLIRGPWFDNNYDLRLQTSFAMMDAIKSKGGGKVYPCLAYCTKDYGLDKGLKSQATAGFSAGTRTGGIIGATHLKKLASYNVAARINNRLRTGTNKKAYARWIIRNLALYMLGVSADDVAMDDKAVLPANPDEEIMRLSGRRVQDQRMLAHLAKTVKRENTSSSDAGQLKKLADAVSEQYGGVTATWSGGT